MSHQCQVAVVGIRLQFFQLPKHEENIGFTAFIDLQAAHIGHPDPGHQWRIGRKILLNARDQISSRRKDIGQERILGVPDGVAVADDGDRKLPVAGIRLHLVVTTHGKIHGDGPLSCGVEEI